MSSQIHRKKPMGRVPLNVRGGRINIFEPRIFELVKSGNLKGLIELADERIARSPNERDDSDRRLLLEAGWVVGAFLLKQGRVRFAEKYLVAAAEALPDHAADYFDELAVLTPAVDNHELAVSDETTDRIKEALDAARATLQRDLEDDADDQDADSGVSAPDSGVTGNLTSDEDDTADHAPAGDDAGADTLLDVLIRDLDDVEMFLSEVKAQGLPDDLIRDAQQQFEEMHVFQFVDNAPDQVARIQQAAETAGGYVLVREKPFSIDDLDESRLDRAEQHMEAGRIREAIALFRDGLRYDPFMDDVWHSLGSCYILLDDIDKALDAYEEALDINPNDPDHFSQAGLCCMKLGDYVTAKGYLNDCLEINPDDEKALELLHAIEAEEETDRLDGQTDADEPVEVERVESVDDTGFIDLEELEETVTGARPVPDHYGALLDEPDTMNLIGMEDTVSYVSDGLPPVETARTDIPIISGSLEHAGDTVRTEPPSPEKIPVSPALDRDDTERASRRSRRLQAIVQTVHYSTAAPAGASDRYKTFVNEAAVDSQIEPSRRKQLDAQAEELGLTPLQAARLEAEALGYTRQFEMAVRKYSDLYALFLAAGADNFGMREYLRFRAEEMELSDPVTRAIQNTIMEQLEDDADA